MWIRTGSLLCLFTVLVSSCKTGCSADEREAARVIVADAFSEWREALNYMDDRVIRNAYRNFRFCAAEAMLCIDMDSTALHRLAAINEVFTDPEPDSEKIRMAEVRIAELASVFSPQAGE
jgi:hypothetical protein